MKIEMNYVKMVYPICEISRAKVSPSLSILFMKFISIFGEFSLKTFLSLNILCEILAHCSLFPEFPYASLMGIFSLFLFYLLFDLLRSNS